MQSIKIINPNGLEARFTLDKVDGAPHAFVFNTLYGAGKPESEVFELSVPEQDGAYPQGQLLRPRTMEFSAYVTGRTQEEMYANREHLQRVLTTSGADMLRIEYRNDFGAWYVQGIAKTYDDAERTDVGHQFKPITISLYCPKPYWLAADGGDGAVIAHTPSMFYFPFYIPRQGLVFGDGGYRGVVINRGNLPAPVRIRIAGPAIRPRIVNQTIGKRIELALSLLPYEQLEINTAKGEKYLRVVNTLTDASRDVWGDLEFGNNIALWELAPGENTIVYANDRADVTDTRIAIEWESPLSGA